MKKPYISRRDVLQGSTALAASSVFASVHIGGSARRAPVTPQLIEAAKKEGKVVFYTSIDLPVAERIAKTFEAKYPGIAVRVERTAPSACSSASAGICEPDPCRRRGQFRPMPRISSCGSAKAFSSPTVPEGRCQVLSRGAQGSGRHVRDLPRLGVRHRLQHQHGEGEDAPKSYCRPARSEMDQQDRQRRIRATAAPS
jgi:hypothetical protein